MDKKEKVKKFISLYNMDKDEFEKKFMERAYKHPDKLLNFLGSIGATLIALSKGVTEDIGDLIDEEALDYILNIEDNDVADFELIP